MTSQHPLLMLVDDDEQILDLVARFARREGFDVVTCASGRQAIEQLQRQPADLAMVDLRLPDVNGLDVLRAIRETVPGCAVVLMTGYAGIEGAVDAIKLGAIDYLAKPLDFDRLSRALRDVREEAERRRSLLAAEEEVARRLEFCDTVGRNVVMQEILSLVRRLAPPLRAALATGETGTGKELAARALPPAGTAEPAGAAAPPPFPTAAGQLQDEREADLGQESLASVERDHILRTLRRVGGNKKAAARMLGLSRRALYRRLERHRLDQTITRRKAGQPTASRSAAG